MSIVTNGNQEISIQNSPRGAQPLEDAVLASAIHQAIGSGAIQRAPAIPPSTGPSLAVFWSELDRLGHADAALRAALQSAAAKSASQALLATGAAAPSEEEFAELIREGELNAARSPIKVNWWGFNIHIPHRELASFVEVGAGVAEIVALFSRASNKVKPWVTLVARFAAAALSLLARLDRGNGVYISMSWFAPGVFVPTSA